MDYSKSPLFNPENYILVRHGNCINDVANPEFKFPKVLDEKFSYREFTCGICNCKFLIRSEAIGKLDFSCPNYQCPAYIHLYRDSYSSYIPWSCNLI
jgi:hypothetical protein